MLVSVRATPSCPPHPVPDLCFNPSNGSCGLPAQQLIHCWTGRGPAGKPWRPSAPTHSRQAKGSNPRSKNLSSLQDSFLGAPRPGSDDPGKDVPSLRDWYLLFVGVSTNGYQKQSATAVPAATSCQIHIPMHLTPIPAVCPPSMLITFRLSAPLLCCFRDIPVVCPPME